VAEDGYIVGATVSYLNGSGRTTTTGEDGTFTLSGGNGALLLTGGTDRSTGLVFTGTLEAPAGSTVISPLTTLVEAVVAESGKSGSNEIAAATAEVDASLGLPAGTDLTTLDVVAGTLAGDHGATEALFEGSELEDTLALIAAAGGSAAAALSYLASVAKSGKSLSLTDAATIRHAATAGGVSAGAATAISSIVSATANHVDVQIVTAATPTAVFNDITGASIAQQGGAAAALKAGTDYAKIATQYNSGLSATLATDDGIAASNDAACYCRGTPIATPFGEVAIEDLRIGDSVTTISGHVRAVRWIGRRDYAAAFIANNPRVWPVRIAAGALAEGRPKRDLLVSPNHALFLDGMLVEAGLLTNGASITVRSPEGPVEYFNVELESHDVILAEGAAAETFLDRDCRDMFQNAAEYRTLYPDAAPDPQPAFYARRVIDGAALEAIRRRLDARAGPTPAIEPAPPGRMSGSLDRLDHSRIAGWVIDVDRPGTAVALDVVLDGAAVLRIVANRFRPDLREVGDRSGRCSFDVSWPSPLDPYARHVVIVRRVEDGIAMPGAPAILEAATPFATMAPAVAQAVDDACRRADAATLDAAISALMHGMEVLLADAAGRGGERAARAARFDLGTDARRLADAA
jgi:hypothetical protein